MHQHYFTVQSTLYVLFALVLCRVELKQPLPPGQSIMGINWSYVYAVLLLIYSYTNT